MQFACNSIKWSRQYTGWAKNSAKKVQESAQDKKGLLNFFLNRWIFGKITSKKLVVSCAFFVFQQCGGQVHKVHEATTLLLVTLPNIHRFKNFFLIWLLTTPPHLKYVTTLPCTLSLIACFTALLFHKAVWQYMQGSVGPLITTSLQIYYTVFNSENQLTFDRYMALTSMWVFFGPPCKREKQESTVHSDNMIITAALLSTVSDRAPAKFKIKIFV